jgi:putative addiction module CopG family antidote
MSRVDLPDDLVRQAQAQVAAGRAASIEDVVRAGVDALELRDQRRYEEKLAKLRAAIDEGDDSGVFEGDPFDHVRAKHGLESPGTD